MAFALSYPDHPRLALERHNAPGDADVPGKIERKESTPAYIRFWNRLPEDNKAYYERYVQRWKYLQAAAGAIVVIAELDKPLLARCSYPSVIENGSLPLDFIHGHIKIDAEQVKGCARSYAETIWFPDVGQNVGLSFKDQIMHWKTIEDVFGWAPGSNTGKEDWLPNEVRKEVEGARGIHSSSVGAIHFDEAIPESQPELVMEIQNVHHQAYYRDEAPPGDWEMPIPILFPAVKPGEKFLFPVSVTRRVLDPEQELQWQAIRWLKGALKTIGLGAKTSADYGKFKEGVTKRYGFQ